MQKDFAKNFVEITEKHLYRGLFFKRETFLLKGSVIGVNSAHLFKTLALEMSVNAVCEEKALSGSLFVKFQVASMSATVLRISFKFPESLNRVIF